MNWLSRFVSGSRPPLPDAVEARVTAWHQASTPDLAHPHFETRYVVVNTEATGLSLEKDKLLALSAIAIEGGVLSSRNAIYLPLDDDPAEALSQLLAFAGRSPWVVFNASFNRKLLERAFDGRFGFEPDPVWMDLQWLLPALFPEHHADLVRLGDWMEAFEIETFQRHHALGDGLAIAQLLMAALGRAHTTGAVSGRNLVEMERTRRWARRSV